ncbi:hypothetical protein J7337_006815 [Fusarium musae]|uniref:Uncharacterized protein n=1 Tax=Fusarium musae TaxID=1042133 RepID=A0A9P8DFV4_9HYPO|nr:hypothetical protein J7337_006815 [Fusarium musae]KAG9501131.1 hypothetical protein J7337_006815 [Fusarium musae]
MVGTQGAPSSTFFDKDAISRGIFDMARKAKYLYRVKDWLLLAPVAEKLRLQDVSQLILDNLCLFCRADKRELPEEVRDCIEDRDWAKIQDLGLIELQHVPTVDRFLVTNFNGSSSQHGYGRCALRLTKIASLIYFTQ